MVNKLFEVWFQTYILLGFGRTRLNSILKCSSYGITLYLDLILYPPHA